MYNTTKTC